MSTENAWDDASAVACRLDDAAIGAFVAGTLASVLGLKMAMILPALTMLLLIASVLVFSRIWTMRTVETPA